MIIETKWSIGDIVWAIMDRQDFDKPIRRNGERTGYESIIKPCVARVVGISTQTYEEKRDLPAWYTLSFGPDEYSSNGYNDNNIYATEAECRAAFEREHPTEAHGDWVI